MRRKHPNLHPNLTTNILTFGRLSKALWKLQGRRGYKPSEGSEGLPTDRRHLLQAAFRVPLPLPFKAAKTTQIVHCRRKSLVETGVLE